MRYPKLQAAIDELLARIIDDYGEAVIADLLSNAVTVERLVAEPPEPTAMPAKQPEKKAEEGNPQ
jgi:hypothetical protein